MADSSGHLESYRERFLDQLHSSRLELDGHQEFLKYWKSVEREASETEDLDKLETWVKDLARDKDKVSAMKEKLELQKDSDPTAAMLLQIIRQVLAMLEETERKLIRLRDHRRGFLARILFRAGPGVKKKVKPEEEEADKEKKKGDGKKVPESVLAKTAEQKKAEEPKKKMER
ncbi:MAG: hypothetical protein KC635_18495 [Myxococcales bacterium]|nr:hypothetical protein [Myxococcales bacterium]